MSDLDPHPQPPDLEDPSVTRLLTRTPAGSRFADLLERDRQIATSMSLVVPAGGHEAQQVVEQITGWHPDQLRLEVLAMEDEGDPGRAVLREVLIRSGRSWRVLERPPGGRAAALSAAADSAEHEFVLVGTGGAVPYGLVTGALSIMWAEGGDAALLDGSDATPARVGGTEATGPATGGADAAALLASWLGLTAPSAPGRLVVLRRWVARWLFHELTRSVSPADEVVDRARLLGIAIVHLAQLAPDTPDA